MKLLISLFLSCSVVSFSQDYVTLQELKIKGKVKTIFSTTLNAVNGVVDIQGKTNMHNLVHFNKAGKPTYRISYYQDSSMADRTYFTYNSSHKEILRTNKTLMGEVQKTTVKYDSFQNRIESSFYRNEQLYWIEDWKYDEKNRVIAHSHKDSGWPEYWEYVYDSTGNCIHERFFRDYSSAPHMLQNETTRVYKNGLLIEEQISKSDIGRVTYEYDALNRLISKTEYNPAGVAERKEIFRYSSDLLVEESHYNGDKLILQKQMAYDAKKQLIEELETNKVLNTQSKTTYAYDTHGNWITQKYYNMTTGLLVYQMERKIIYY